MTDKLFNNEGAWENVLFVIKHAETLPGGFGDYKSFYEIWKKFYPEQTNRNMSFLMTLHERWSKEVEQFEKDMEVK